ncbi:MAG: DUF4080 domain-containing protein [Bacteroidales bacterium]
MKILWLDLNSSYSHSSLALPAIHAQCDEQHEWRVIRTNINISVATIVHQVVAERPDLICATAWLFTHEHLLAVLSRVSVLLPGCKIALGGPEFLGENESYLRQHPFVDMVFRGEGEENLPKWLDVLDSTTEWNAIEGVCYIDEEDLYHDGGLARVMDFASLKAPETSPFFCRDRAFVQFETARGCFNTCAFCVSGADKPVRFISLEEVRERLYGYYEMGITSIRLLDRTFNGQSKRAIQMLELFEEFNGKLNFHLEVHPAMLGDEVKAKLRTMPHGLLHLEAGIQSLRQEVLTESRRLGSLEASLEGLRFLCSLDNMETHADLIAGLPRYTYPMMVEDIHTLAAFDAGEIQMELLKLLPGTRMRREASQLGILYAPYPPYEVLQSDGMSAADLLRSRLLSRLLDMYYNTGGWQEVFRALMMSENSFLEAFLDYLAAKEVLEQPLSLERRGMLLYEFVKEYYPSHLKEVSLAWIKIGMPLGKEPAQRMKALLELPDQLEVLEGIQTNEMRYYYLDEYVFGFDRGVQRQKPVFIAKQIPVS